MKKRILSVLLALALVLVPFPGLGESALAAYTPEELFGYIQETAGTVTANLPERRARGSTDYLRADGSLELCRGVVGWQCRRGAVAAIGDDHSCGRIPAQVDPRGRHRRNGKHRVRRGE